MGRGNAVVPLLALAGGGALVYVGFTNPAGGAFAGLGGLLRGQPVGKATANPSAFLSTAADLAAVAGGRGGGSAPPAPPAAPASYGGGSSATGARARVLASARGWLGVPYSWGGITRKGVDCSGLTRIVYAGVGLNLPHLAAAQQGYGQARTAATAQPGDLVFFGVPAHHVGIYLGGGQIIHAPHPGASVRIEHIWSGERVTYRDVLTGRHKTKDVNA